MNNIELKLYIDMIVVFSLWTSIVPLSMYNILSSRNKNIDDKKILIREVKVLLLTIIISFAIILYSKYTTTLRILPIIIVLIVIILFFISNLRRVTRNA